MNILQKLLNRIRLEPDPARMFFWLIAVPGLAFTFFIIIGGDTISKPRQEPFKEESLAARAVIESGQILIQAQQDLITSLEVQLQLVQEERDAWKKLANPPVSKAPKVHVQDTGRDFSWMTVTGWASTNADGSFLVYVPEGLWGGPKP